MNTCVISDLPPLNNSSSLRFFTILASKEGALGKQQPEHGRREQELFQGSAGGGKNSDHFL